ncbi:dihydroneopterin aldolase [Burkholderia multivorans]|uniref:dihydroneopterin aldolase n=1 Tax=Burkholderia multivorans TaxID=87883 RepID=UPI00018E321A|nr:dihydroneopterin aldolase [Burkholderia multivorans]EED98994.1 dihydroneopterin aldolase [Burkholderia multivorans CGD1]
MNVTKGEPEIEWEVVIERLRADTRIGIHDHERAPQPVVINAVLRCRAIALPERIDDCLDYDAFCWLLRAHLERQTHTDLVERLAADLLVLAFERFSMLDDASLTVYKPHAVRAAESVGVRLHWRRDDYRRLCGDATATCDVLSAFA